MFIQIIEAFSTVEIMFSVVPPPTKLTLTLAGKAKEEQSKYEIEGSYTLADNLVNGYPHWLKNEGSQAIWFDKLSSAWVVHNMSTLGHSFGGIAGPKGKDTNPNEITYGWRYWDNGLQDAPYSDIVFKVRGTFFNS